MISLRQHAISLAAVFLALAIGVVLGSGFFSDTLLSSLRNEKRDLAAQISGLNDQRNALNEKLSAANTFDNQVLGRIVHDALAGKAVVIFRTPDAKDDDVAMVSKIVGQAGGSVTGTVSLTQEFVEANSAEKLRSVVNSSILPAGTQLSTKLVDQGSQAGDLLGIALLSPVNPAQPAGATGRRRPARHRAGGAARDRLHHLSARRPLRSGKRGHRHHRRGPARRCRQPGGQRGAVRRCAGAARFRHRARRPGWLVDGQRGRRSHPRRCRHGRHRQHRRRRRRRARPHHGDPGPARPHQRRATGPLWHRSRGHVGDCSPIVPR
ncbi:hypothetical protein I547_6271 [Mycobacterium kansasii 824]|nr:hypothetical protein I547_6271 [Mycobacterium kansasii 824]